MAASSMAGMEGMGASSGLQGFIDSPEGNFFATILHWVGALSFIAGVGFLIAHRVHRRGGAHPEQTPVLPGVLILGGIVFNLTGGFLRLWQSDHPHITQIQESSWVQALFAKHMLLVAAMGASVIALGASTPWIRARFRWLSLGPRRFEPLFALAVIGVVGATFIGALATTIVHPDTGMVGPGALDSATPPIPLVASVHSQNVTGAITGSPIAPGAATQQILVEPGGTRFVVTLSWQDATAQLGLQMADPDAKSVQATTSGMTARLEIEDPRAGTWNATVTAARAVGAAYRLEIVQEARVLLRTSIERTVTLPPGGSAGILVAFPGGGALSYAYDAQGAGATFEIHRTTDGRSFVSDSRQNVNATFAPPVPGEYGLTWSNTGASVATVHVVLDGPFHVVKEAGTWRSK